VRLESGGRADALIRRWDDRLAGWGAPSVDVRAAGAALIARYLEPHRRYHTAEHLAQVLDALGEIDPTLREVGRAQATELAAWFHDAVYEPSAATGANEEASAGLARVVLGGLGVPEPVLTETARLIVLTGPHAPDRRDRPGCALCDADLSILGAPADRYRRYAADVRAEYGFVDEPDWRRGRSAVLEAFVARPRLYLTDRAHHAFEHRARQNLLWELSALGGGQAEP
jgi:predicted metal-dependent HD superfamily phosphohydrolase